MESSAAPVEVTERQGPLTVLRQFVRRRVQTEACEFCSEGLGPEHRHVLEVGTRKILCACTACAFRFENVVGKYTLIPRDAQALEGFRISDEQWEALSLPINLAFMLRSTPAARVMALYPSPAGATESLLPLASWESLVRENPVLEQMRPEVEALLANRLKDKREYYLAPIDRCYELVGLIRLHWRGFSGGDQVWREVDKFFVELKGAHH